MQRGTLNWQLRTVEVHPDLLDGVSWKYRMPNGSEIPWFVDHEDGNVDDDEDEVEVEVVVAGVAEELASYN